MEGHRKGTEIVVVRPVRFPTDAGTLDPYILVYDPVSNNNIMTRSHRTGKSWLVQAYLQQKSSVLQYVNIIYIPPWETCNFSALGLGYVREGRGLLSFNVSKETYTSAVSVGFSLITLPTFLLRAH